MISKFKYVFLFLAISLFGQVNFSNPLSTNGGAPNITPSLAIETPSASQPSIVSDSTGKYVYATWFGRPGAKYTIQFSRSEDFGLTWSSALTLSNPAVDSQLFSLTTDSTGKNVYVVWTRTPGAPVDVAVSNDYGQNFTNKFSYTPSSNSGNPIIKSDSSGRYVYVTWREDSGNKVSFIMSSDYGQTWSAPKNLAPLGESASQSELVISKTGQYVYVVWDNNIGPNYFIQLVRSTDYGQNFNATPINIISSTSQVVQPNITTSIDGKYVYATWMLFDDDLAIARIQVAISSDYGISWISPSSTPPGTISPNLSIIDYDSGNQKVVTSDSGKYVYVIWETTYPSSPYNVVNIAISDNYGMAWENPLQTGSISPILSEINKIAFDSYITTNSSGKNIYVIWRIYLGKMRVQFVSSSDYGASWINPITASLGTISPNISESGYDATDPKVVTSADGNKVYAIWSMLKLSGYTIQVADGITQPYIHFPVNNVSPIR